MKNMIVVVAFAVFLISCDEKIEEEDAGPDGGCAQECDDTDWD